jgi:hypothetical protein
LMKHLKLKKKLQQETFSFSFIIGINKIMFTQLNFSFAAERNNKV